MLKNAMLLNTTQILNDLVQFAPVTGTDNSRVVTYIKSLLEKNGMHVDLVPKSETQNNIVATIGPEDRPTFIFSGHIDVMPPDEYSKHSGWWCYNQDVTKTPEPSKAWTDAPHSMVERADRLYGRGTCDMLGAVASLLNFSQVLDKERLKHRVMFSFTCDEETDMASISKIIEKEFPDKMASNFPAGCIVMEPTEMRPVIAHRGVVAGKISVTGRTSHVSRPDLMVDPLPPLLDTLKDFREVAGDYVRSETPDPHFIPESSNYTIYSLKTHEHGRDTSHVAEFGYVFHYLPESYPQSVLTRMDEIVSARRDDLQKIDPSYDITHVVDFKLRPFSLDESNPLLETVFDAACVNVYDKVGFFTEAGAFHEAEIPVIIIGPGSILQAHVPDEFVEIEQLDKADKFLKNLHDNFLCVPK